VRRNTNHPTRKSLHHLTASLHDGRKLIPRVDKSSLPLPRLCPAESTVCIKCWKKRQTDSRICCGGRDAPRKLAWIGKGSPTAIVVQVMKFADLCKSTLEHLGVRQRCYGLHLIRRDAIYKLIHQLAPRPEAIAFGTATLCQARDASLESVAVKIRYAGDTYSEPFVRIIGLNVCGDAVDSTVRRSNSNVTCPTGWQQSGLKPQTRHVARHSYLGLSYSISMITETRLPWLTVTRGESPLIVTMPHTGVDIPRDIEYGLVSPWLARKDADWWVNLLYDFAHSMGATVIRTGISRTVIDCNRDPSGVSLYPGQATTELCPTTTFDGEPLYRPGFEPRASEIALRRSTFFDPYHEAIADAIKRLRAKHNTVVLYDCHSIRSKVPRLFEGTLPNFNIGTNNGATCSPALTSAVEAACDETGFTRVTNGRFRGGYTTRHYGRPTEGVHAVQMELACRGYMREPLAVSQGEWPTRYDEEVSRPMRTVLTHVLQACIRFAT
jgi:N-formylglutamate deformylase